MTPIEFRIQYLPAAKEFFLAAKEARPAAPLPISEWLAASLLQKAIRRGETSFALSAATTLITLNPQRLFRRLIVMVFEDIGLANPSLIASTVLALSSKAFRSAVGGDLRVVNTLVEAMSASPKCRAPDDLLMTLLAHPTFEVERKAKCRASQTALMLSMFGSEEIVSRAIALVYAAGSEKLGDPRLLPRRGDNASVVRSFREQSIAIGLVDAAERGVGKVREPLPLLMLLCARERDENVEPSEVDDDFLPEAFVGPVPEWALDYYTRPGRSALRLFLSKDTPTSRWLHRNLPPRHRLEALGGIVFRVSGGLMKRRVQWSLGLRLRRLMEVESLGFGIEDASEVLNLMRDDVSALSAARREIGADQ